MIDNVIDFGNVPARELMRPPPEVLRVRDGMRVTTCWSLPASGNWTTCRIADAGGQAVAALVDVFTLLLERDPHAPAAAYLRRPPLVAAPDEPAVRVLRRLRAARFNVGGGVRPAGRSWGSCVPPTSCSGSCGRGRLRSARAPRHRSIPDDALAGYWRKIGELTWKLMICHSPDVCTNWIWMFASPCSNLASATYLAVTDFPWG